MSLLTLSPNWGVMMYCCLNASTFSTLFKGYGVITSLSGQERYIMKSCFELLHPTVMTHVYICRDRYLDFHFFMIHKEVVCSIIVLVM